MISKTQVHKIVENNRQEIIDCLVELIQTPSITGDEVPISKVISKWITKAGIDPQIHGISPEHPNVFGEWYGTKKGKRFIFNGHMDTFPPIDDDLGLYGPFSGKIVDGYIYGRGAADMKGGNAAALMAVTLLKRMDFDPKGSILLSYMCDEEIGGRYGVKWAVKQDLLNGDFGICMEPTGGKILVSHSGIFRLFIIYTSEAYHSAKDHPTKNALEKAIIAINSLYNYRNNVVRKKIDPFFVKPSLSITTINAGNASNVHASHAKFSIDYRMIPGETHDSVGKDIFSILDRLKEKDPEMEYSYEMISDRPVLQVPENSTIVKVCCESYEDATGKPAELYYRHGGSDAATIQEYNGIEMPNWGAADDSEIALPNEKINVEDYIKSVEYYMLALIKIMG